MKTEPSKAVEPTIMIVTFRAYVGTAPSMIAAHICRWVLETIQPRKPRADMKTFQPFAFAAFPCSVVFSGMHFASFLGLALFLATILGETAQAASKAHTIFAESTRSRFKPIAIYNDGTSATALEVRRPTSGGTISGTFYNHGSSLTVAGNNSASIPVVLRDDGSQGDALSGDGIYTLWPITSTKAGDQFNGRLHWNSYSLAIDGVASLLSTKLGIVNSGIEYRTRTLGTDVDGNPIVASDFIVNIQDDAMVDGSTSGTISENHGAISDKFYSVLDDRFDFLVLISVLQTDNGTAHYFALRNDVSGLGNSGFGQPFDYSTTFGIPPSGKNTGVLDGMPYINDGGSSVYGALHHEMMHRWGVSFGNDLGFAFGGHWNGMREPGVAYMGNFLGALGGGVVTENGDGTITIVGAPAPTYPKLELYLMGLVGPSEVPVHTFYRYSTSDRSLIKTFDLSIYDLTSAFGPRLPAVTNSPKDFAAAFVVVTPPGEALTRAEVAMYSLAAEHFGSNSPGDGFFQGPFLTTPSSFAWATGFRATMRTSVFPLAAACPRITAISVDVGAHTASLKIFGKAGATYDVYSSLNLADWGIPIGSATTDNNGDGSGDATFEDRFATERSKFYRVQEQ